jgi:hypothetical protein
MAKMAAWGSADLLVLSKIGQQRRGVETGSNLSFTAILDRRKSPTQRRAFSFLLFAGGALAFMVCCANNGAGHARDLGHFLPRGG